MADAKTIETDTDPRAVLATATPDVRREDALVLLDLFERITGWVPRVWGDSIVGFGAYDYHYDSGHTGRWFRTGFAARKAHLAIYLIPGVARYPDLLAQLGPHKHSVSCLYITQLSKIDIDVLSQMICASDDVTRIYGAPD